ncbi:MAG TPA: class I SAM-dependent methyltransferase [Blastocatellia bacterium]|jgi:ubiquinone/menaquinone biosynthesis C-methylase UbiE|nr:class I SAM-dependent methyltransferase [Blastocatellia bacterium]
MAENLKARVHDFWQANPCGAKFAQSEIGSAEFFAEVERHRYTTEPHIPGVVDFKRWRDCEVLEVGCGLGTDAVNFARHGARYTGVDLTETSIDLVRRRFQLEELPATLRTADAENLPFDDESFDLVYSHGVLHHTPDTQRAINEVHRVLKPGGTAMVMLYHKNSFNYYVNILTIRRVGARLLRFKWGPAFIHLLTGEDKDRLIQIQQFYLQDPKLLLSREEFLNQNTDGAGNPLARVYSREEGTAMFSRFGEVRTEVHFLNKRWIPLVGGLLPRWAERNLDSRMGWHLWMIARR